MPRARSSSAVARPTASVSACVIGRAQGHRSGEARRLVAEADELAALLVGSDEERQPQRVSGLEALGEVRQLGGVPGVGAQEEGDAVGLTGSDAAQQPGRRLEAVEGRQELAEDRLGLGAAAPRHPQPLTEPARMPRTK